MEIYVEDILLSNTLLTFIKLWQIKSFFKINKSNALSFVASLIGALISLFYPLLNLSEIELVIFKILVMLLILKIAFINENRKKLFFIALSFLFYSFIFSGLVTLFYNKSVNSVFLIFPFLVVSIVINRLKLYFEKKLKVNNFLLKAEFYLNGKSFYSMCFLDSGNSLKYNGKNLMIVSMRLLLKFFPNYLKNSSLKLPFEIIDFLDFESVNTKGKIFITKIEKIVIYQSDQKHIFNDVAVGVNLNNFDGYDLLISYENLS